MQQLTEARWALGINALVVLCRTQHEARWRVVHEHNHWSELAARFGVPKTLLKYPRCHRPFEILAAEATGQSNPYRKILMSSLHLVSPIPLTPRICRALDTIASNPGEQWFLHRISPDLNRMTQIAVSEAASSLIVGTTPERALLRDRRDYMLIEDLEALRRDMRQQMAILRRLETRWRGFSPVTRADYRKFAYRYEIVEELPTGEVIQVGKCLGVEPLSAPVR